MPTASLAALDHCRGADARYTHVDDIACGGMGQVALVHDADVERQVAMKTLLPGLADSDGSVRDFLAEARVIGGLEHPNIVPLYDLGVQESGDMYFTMQFVKGRTLAEVIASLQAGDAKDHLCFTWARRAQILQQVCDAVAYAHEHGVAHRDLKPANIMFGEHGEVVVMDWGLAASSREEERVRSTSPIAGTPAYLCPEAISCGSVDNIARDVYAMGILAYELFTLELPFKGASVESVLIDVIRAQPKPLYEVRQEYQRTVPVEIYHIVRRAIAPNPQDRYANCVDLRDALQLYLDGRFPIRCPSTALKRWALMVAHTIDDHPKAAVLVTLCAVVASLATALAVLVRMI
jgi:serine/threonine-protein kinase